MTVYNTGTVGDVTPGAYYNNGSKWVQIGSGSLTVETDGGLTIISPMSDNESYTFGISTGGVTTAKIADAAVTADKLDAMGAEANQALVYNGTAWAPTALSASAYSGGAAPCPGAIIYNGAYRSPASYEYTTDLDGPFFADWTNSAFTVLNKDLCVAVSDAASTHSLSWFDARTACGSDWRLPNLMEMHVMYKALGGSGSTVTSFSVLDTNGRGEGGYRLESLHTAYWTSSEHSLDNAYVFWFLGGERIQYTKEWPNPHVRCVRSL
jgi:hypothetical protein